MSKLNFAGGALIAVGLVFLPIFAKSAHSQSEDALTARENSAQTAQLSMPDFVQPIGLRWDVQLPGQAITPIIANGNLFALSWSRNSANIDDIELEALSTTNGSIVWGPVEVSTGSNIQWTASETYDEGDVFVAESDSTDTNVLVSAYDASTGSMLWRSSAPGMMGGYLDSQPTAFNGYIYIEVNGNVSCLRESDGVVMWSKLTTMYSGALAVSQDGVFYGSFGGSAKFDLSTGDNIWFSPNNAGLGIDATNSLYQGYLLSPYTYFSAQFVDGTNSLSGVFNAETGAFVASFPYAGLFACDNGMLFTVWTNITSRSTSDWSVAWSVPNPARATYYTDPVVVNGVVYFASLTGSLYGYDENSGGLLNTVSLGPASSFITASNIDDIIAGDGIIAVPVDDELVAVGDPIIVASLSPSTPNGSNGAYSSAVTVSVSAAPESSMDYSIDGGSTQTYTVPFQVSTEGNHSVRCWSLDSGGNTLATTTQTFTIAYPSLKSFSPGLQMIATTEDDSSLTLAEIFDNPPLTLAIWNNSAGGYDLTPDSDANTLALGKGYWVRFAQTTNLLDVASPADPTQAFQISLQAGWNMIGSPRSSAVALSSITVTDGSGTAPFASSSDDVSQTLYTYGPSSVQYKPVDANGSLQPFAGYWIYAQNACTLNFPASS